MELSPQEIEKLMRAAENAAQLAYAPYSKFRVGAAILGKKDIYVGANVENASYGLTLCAERSAFAHAIVSGERDFLAIAVACIDAKDKSNIKLMMPCGACRQWMAELAPNAMIIICGTNQCFSLDDLLPISFRLM